LEVKKKKQVSIHKVIELNGLMIIQVKIKWLKVELFHKESFLKAIAIYFHWFWVMMEKLQYLIYRVDKYHGKWPHLIEL